MHMHTVGTSKHSHHLLYCKHKRGFFPYAQSFSWRLLLSFVWIMITVELHACMLAPRSWGSSTNCLSTSSHTVTQCTSPEKIELPIFLFHCHLFLHFQVRNQSCYPPKLCQHTWYSPNHALYVIRACILNRMDQQILVIL